MKQVMESPKKLKFKARQEGWFWAPREWTKVTPDTGIGNPAQI